MIRRPLFLWIFLTLLNVPAMAGTPNLAGIVPAIAPPGSTVTIIGGPFGDETRVVFGDQILQPANIADKRLTFIVPQLLEGDYLLYLQEGEALSERSLFFRILLPSPSIVDLNPSIIETCATGEQRQVELRGRDLQPGVQVLLDGVALAAERSGDSLTFNIPELVPGMHQVQLANPDGRHSLPVSLQIDALPEILDVSRGEENVNYYQLLIIGKNFSYKSTLVVNGQPIAPIYPGSLQVDSIRYLDCNRLIYKRYPPSSQTRQINLQIINPDGRESPVFTFSGP
jgi:hypothetical protein